MKKTMPTMKDVAQEAGVALGTVSKVFNGIAVGESYRVKVEAAAQKLGYEVNQYARGLRAGTIPFSPPWPSTSARLCSSGITECSCTSPPPSRRPNGNAWGWSARTRWTA